MTLTSFVCCGATPVVLGKHYGCIYIESSLLQSFQKSFLVSSQSFEMHFQLLPLFLGACLAVPIIDREQQALRSSNGNGPYTPDHKDPYDHKVDSYGNDWQPLPWRNGDGATMMGPQNKDRERQNPDMMRPPSTDHGSMSNYRWSFADSHMRIEVSSRRICS